MCDVACVAALDSRGCEFTPGIMQLLAVPWTVGVASKLRNMSLPELVSMTLFETGRGLLQASQLAHIGI